MSADLLFTARFSPEAQAMLRRSVAVEFGMEIDDVDDGFLEHWLALTIAVEVQNALGLEPSRPPGDFERVGVWTTVGYVFDRSKETPAG